MHTGQGARRKRRHSRKEQESPLTARSQSFSSCTDQFRCLSSPFLLTVTIIFSVVCLCNFYYCSSAILTLS
ncbi:MAG: hypothetical protein ACPIOQ_55010, partial [Promethearchaeia archaeon]